MGMFGDIAREGMATRLCEVIKTKIEEHPDSAVVLKEVGREVLAELDYTPEQLILYQQLFDSNSGR